jgi:alkanesulfonate monooxygenase SsuD/methylene tetrahydromethanopterin reductase-like flavin-dependent oxidoreductase (luciferase family)
MEDHGVKFETRHKVARERIEAMKAIWTQVQAGVSRRIRQLRSDDDLAEAGAEAASAGDRGSAAFPYSARRAIRYGDGWIPHRVAAAIRQRARHAPRVPQAGSRGRPRPASVPVTIWGAKENEDMLKADRDAGVVRVIVSLDSAESDVILPQLDRWAKLLQKVDMRR